jgi:MFS family permease
MQPQTPSRPFAMPLHNESETVRHNQNITWRRQLPFFYGWVVVAVAFVTLGIGVNTRTAFSLLFPPILAEFGWARGITAAAFSIGFMASTLYAPFLGLLMDRFGPRWIISFGVVLVSCGMALATMVTQTWHLYATLGTMVVGGSIFLSYIGHSLFLPNWFVKKRGLAIGIAFSGVGVGSIILFPWLQTLIGKLGWRQACWSLAILLLTTLLPLNLIFQRQRPETLGLKPDGDAITDSGGLPASTLDNVVDHAWVAVDWTLWRALKTTKFWWVFIAFFSGLFAWYMVQVHQTKYLIEIGFDADLAAYALGFVGFTGIIGQIALGHLSDRIGREWVWTLSTLGYVICYSALLLMQTYPSLFMLYLVVGSQGLLGYSLAAVFGAIPAEIFQGKHYGTIFGTLNLASSTGAAAGPWLAGWLYDRTGTYALAFALAIGFSLISMCSMWFAAPRQVRAVAGRIAVPKPQRP